MGSCFSKNNNTATLTTTSQQSELKSNPPQPQNPNNEQQVVKKEIFVIKHRISHEIDRLPDENDPNLLNPSAVAGNGGGARVRTASCSKEEVDAILIQCGRLSRSNSAGAQNPRRRRRYSGSKRSFDFDLNLGLKNDDNDDNDNDDVDGDDEGLNHHRRRRNRQQSSRVSSPSSRRSSRERDFRQQRCNSGRRISISPSRRSESPFSNSNCGAGAMAGGSNTRPMKMVPVPATDKSNNAGGEEAVGGGVKRIHVKRNVAVVSRTAASPPHSRSPARTNLRIFSDDQGQERSRQQEIDMRVADRYRSPCKRKSLAEIDNNAARSVQPKMVDEAKMVAMVENLKLQQNITRTRISRLSQDLDTNDELMFEPSPPSYASLLLEDIHNFHQKNTNSAATAPPPFSLPACVSKACSIMEAVADLNSNTTTTTGSSLFSEERWRNPTPIERYINKDRFIESETVVNGGLMEPSLHSYVTARRGGCAATEEQESSDSSSFTGSQRLSRRSPSVESNSADPTTRKCKMNPLGDFQSKLLDYPRKGIGRGRKSAYSTPEITTVAST
ncbi:hypothetical protein L6452_40155 [Arctium lappa]|uniref:Uncharacterized protein n=1 Tax=Arctium lappa TaxID=4217 RepID=A0ACB8XLI0_ARCLA|nr:hypothetical protein L6452_40155 [Arctium lappa]